MGPTIPIASNLIYQSPCASMSNAQSSLWKEKVIIEDDQNKALGDRCKSQFVKKFEAWRIFYPQLSP
jgi:hypothetical protein